MANDINKEDPHYKGEYGSIYEVNRKFPSGGVAGDFVVIDGWAHYWNADRGTWCVNAERDSYWDELITNIIEKFKLVRGATYMGVASLDTVPTKVIGAKMYYFATVAGTYKNFGGLVVPQGINVLYSENGSSWVNTTLLEVAQELGVSTNKVVSQKAVSDKLSDLAEKKFDKENIAQEFGDSEDKVVSQFALPFREIESPEFIKVIVDANDHLLFTINLDGEVDWGKGIPAPIKAKFQEIINQCQQDKTDLLESINTLKGILDKTTIKDEEGIVFETPFRYIQNEEFIFAKVDAEDKLLFGIQWDGTPVFGKTSAVEDRLQEQVTLLAERVATIIGFEDTTNVIDTMNELKKFFAEIENTQTLTSILKNLKNLNTKFGEDIKNLQDTKVDKEEGKSLIENEVKECFRVISNEEFLWAVVDSEDRVLFGFYRATGKPYYPLNEMYHVEQNEEFFAVWLDAANHVLFGIRRDGEIIGEIHAVNVLKETIKKIQKDIQDDISSLRDEVGAIDANLKELLDIFSIQENPEYLAVEKDADGRILSTTNPDGSHYSHNLKSETIETKVDKEEGKSLIDSDVANANTAIEDPENRLELITDANGKVLGYRDESGKRYESSMDIRELSLDGTKLDLSQFPTKKDVEDLELKNINGVYDNNKPNLYLTSQKTFTTADGKQSFTPPNEGAEMSNRISCKAGDWFTRTGTATGMVVVSDENDNNAVRLMPEGKLPGATVQIPESWNWAAYIRFAVATYESNVVINKGKYAVSKTNDSVSIPKLKLNVANFTKETKYLQSPNGTFYELSVSDTGELSVNLVDKDLIDSFDIPSDLKYTISNPSGGTPAFCGTAKRVLLHNEKYLYELKENGLTKYLSIADSSSYFYNVEHQVNSKGESRIVALLKVAPYIGLCVFDESFTLIDKLSGSYDTHDFIYIDDFHYIVYRNSNIFNIDGHNAYSNKIEEWKDGRKIAEYTLNDVDVLKDIMFDAKVHGTAPIAETHTNTIGFDRTQDRIILNPRNCCSWIILKRTVSDNGNVTFGPVLEQVGGLHASKNYEAVSRRIKTTDLAQWFLCHDVKYWGMKSVNGKEYPTYTLFDNNYLMDENPRNNSSSNSSSNTNSASTCSRVVQLSIDWENRTIVDYKVYAVPKYYSNVMSSAWMMDEGKFCIDYAMMGTIIFADFTTSDTTISEDGHLYTGAKITWKLKQQKLLYRANIY